MQSNVSKHSAETVLCVCRINTWSILDELCETLLLHSTSESDFCFFFTFQEVLSGDEALVVLAKARCSIQQKVGPLILVDPKQNLSVFKVA